MPAGMSSAFFVLLYLAVVGRVLVAGDVPVGVQYDFNIADLTDMLVSPYSTWPYSHSSVGADLICANALYTCLGSMSTAEDTSFSLFACAETSFFLNDGNDLGTSSEAVLNNNAYWYRYPENSVGFSGSSASVELNQADVADGADRLSWHLEGSGGYRSGDAKGLNQDETWQKVVACLNGCPQGFRTLDNSSPTALADCAVVSEGWRIDSNKLDTPIKCPVGTYCPGGGAVGTASAFAINTDSTETNHPCNNTINGVDSSATDVDGNIIIGCNNLVSNNTDHHGHLVSVDIIGSANVVSDNVVSTEVGTYNISLGYYTTPDGVAVTDSASNGNIVVGNVADYIDIWSANNNTVEGNVVSSSKIGITNSVNNTIKNNLVTANAIELTDGADNTVESNVGDYIGVYHTRMSAMKNNVAHGGGANGNAGISLDDDSDVMLAGNEADYMGVVQSVNVTVEDNNVNVVGDPNAYGYIWAARVHNGMIVNNTAR